MHNEIRYLETENANLPSALRIIDIQNPIDRQIEHQRKIDLIDGHVQRVQNGRHIGNVDELIILGAQSMPIERLDGHRHRNTIKCCKFEIELIDPFTSRPHQSSTKTHPNVSAPNAISVRCDMRKIVLHSSRPMISSTQSFRDDPNALFHVRGCNSTQKK